MFGVLDVCVIDGLCVMWVLFGWCFGCIVWCVLNVCV